MATAVSDTYTALTGATIYTGGRHAPVVSPRAAFIGDSLKDPLYGIPEAMLRSSGRNGAPLQYVANLGVSGETVQQIYARIGNNYTNASPGLGGLGTLGHIVIRAMTNNARGGNDISSGPQTAYANLITYCLTKATYVYVQDVPPMSGTDGAYVNNYNSWLDTYVAGLNNPRVIRVNDTVTVNDGTGRWVSTYVHSDGIHEDLAFGQMGIDGGIQLASFFAGLNVPSPLITDPADVYPATPQWVKNPQMAGTGGGNAIPGGVSGQVIPDFWTIDSYNSSNGVTVSKVAAALSDTNQAPWMRITPTNIVGDVLLVRGNLAGAAITSSYPAALEILAEIRFNAFDAIKFGAMQISVYGHENEYLTPTWGKLGAVRSTLTETVIFRMAMPRSTPISNVSAFIQFTLPVLTAYTGSMGSFDIRSVTVKDV